MTIDHLTNTGLQGLSRSVATSDVRGALQAASRATGVDFAYLAAEASLESGLNPDAKAKTSSAAGLFQFIESTWGEMVERHGGKMGLDKEAKALASGDVSPTERRRIMDLRFDAGIAARMGAEFASENKEVLQNRIGREPEDVDLYLAHFLGPGGASKFLTKMDASPDASAADAFPAAAKANRNVFYAGDRARSFAEVRDRFDAKLASRADDIEAVPGAPPSRPPIVSFANVARPPVPTVTAPVTSALTHSARSPVGGDPYFSTLITAQLSMNDSLSRVSGAEEGGRGSFRNLLS
ncbi:MAG: transglycosylase SLT domain-containing protein [Alphaproteobacteria bacterium]